MQTRLGKTIYAFRGIRYAEPPVGPLRFKESLPVKPWKNTFDASQEGPGCPEPNGLLVSEDCLALNVYTKHLPSNYTNPTKKSPVIAYIHFGGYYKGSSQSFAVGPRYLLDEDIVLVSINYRLGTLGYINTGERHAYGNLGFKDQVLALKWIQNYVEAFGGDPNSVTLAGQSSGSRSIVLHMVSPMSTGLFHRAIGLSGSPTTPIKPQKQQIDLAVRQAVLLNCSTESFDAMFDCFDKRSFYDYARTSTMFSEFFHHFPITIWYPSIEPEVLGDHRFLPEDTEKMMKEGRINSVPFIMGVTKDEFGFMAYPTTGADTLYKDLNDRWYELAPICFQYEANTNRTKFISDALRDYYFKNESIDHNTSHRLSDLLGDSLVHFPVHRAATLLSEHSTAPVYFYEFVYKGRYSRRVWKNIGKPIDAVYHGDDLLYIIDTNFDPDNSLRMPFFTDKDPEILMVKRMTKLWAHFAKTSEPLPNDPELYGDVDWQPLKSDTKKYLHMDWKFSMKEDFRGETMRLFDELFP